MRQGMRATAGAVLFAHGRVLLGRRSAGRIYFPGVWDVFGGHSKPGETLEDTLARELDEELGIVPTVFDLLAVLDEPDPDRHGRGRHAVFVVREWSGRPAQRGDEHSEIRWFDTSDLGSIRLASAAYVGLLEQIT